MNPPTTFPLVENSNDVRNDAYNNIISDDQIVDFPNFQRQSDTYDDEEETTSTEENIEVDDSTEVDNIAEDSNTSDNEPVIDDTSNRLDLEKVSNEEEIFAPVVTIDELLKFRERYLAKNLDRLKEIKSRLLTVLLNKITERIVREFKEKLTDDNNFPTNIEEFEQKISKTLYR